MTIASAPRDVLPRRRLDFEFDAGRVPEAWFGDDLFLSLFADALSLVFPEGEKFFVDSVRRHREGLPAELASAAVGFAGQEAMHGKEHRSFNAVLAEHGLASAPALEAHVKRLLDGVRRHAPPRVQLAVTCGLEHFTAILAEQLLTIDAHREAIHPGAKPLWTWHAFEESEHKAVAFDVYRATGGGYPVRAGVMLITTLVFFAELAHIHVRFLADKRILHRPDRWRRGLRHMFVSPGFMTRLLPAWLDYFRPGFHPDDRDTSALLADWRERLFGENGTLTAQLKSVRAA
jgi:predicted metal-dependent hydrolase